MEEATEINASGQPVQGAYGPTTVGTTMQLELIFSPVKSTSCLVQSINDSFFFFLVGGCSTIYLSTLGKYVIWLDILLRYDHKQDHFKIMRQQMFLKARLVWNYCIFRENVILSLKSASIWLEFLILFSLSSKIFSNRYLIKSSSYINKKFKADFRSPGF